MRFRTWGLLLSVGAHVGLWVGARSIPKDAVRKSTLVAVVDKKKKKEEDKPKVDEPPPPPPKPPPPRPKPPPRVENTPPPPAAPPPAAPPPPTPAAAAHPQLAALPSLGISMSGGSGGPGIAVPTGPTGPDLGAPAPAGGDVPKAVAPKKDDCAEDAIKPKLVGGIDQSKIIAAAQTAGGVEGKIRLEILVDEAGNVTSVRVTTGLGGAIDEAAVSAARRVKITPSTRCGKPVAGRLVVSITVRNPD